MKRFLQKAVIASVLLAASALLGACGGGDSAPSSVIEVVTVKKGLQGQRDNYVVDAVTPLTNSGVSIVARKCALLRNTPGNIGTGVLVEAVLVDISAKDVPTAQALGFSLFSPIDIIPGTTFTC